MSLDEIQKEFLSMKRDFLVIRRGILNISDSESSLFDPPESIDGASAQASQIRQLLPKLKSRCVRNTHSHICFSSLERALDRLTELLRADPEDPPDPMCDSILQAKLEMARVAVSFCNAKQSEAKLLESRVLFESIERQATFRRIGRTITRLFKKELSKDAQRELCDRTQAGVAILGDLTYLLSLAQSTHS